MLPSAKGWQPLNEVACPRRYIRRGCGHWGGKGVWLDANIPVVYVT